MDHQTHKKLVLESQQDAERAIIEETKLFHLEYAELSVTVRQLLAKVYIRGGMDVLHKLKPHNDKTTT